MEVGRTYEDLLEKTRVFGQKKLSEFEEEQLRGYMDFLGFPNPFSEQAWFTKEAESVLFLLLCKVLQECSSVTNTKKGIKKELRGHHLRFMGYIISNFKNRRMLSVYNPVFLRLIDLDKDNVDQELAAFRQKVQSKLCLARALYQSEGGSRRDGDCILFSNNELNDLLKVFLNYLHVFQHFLKLSSTEGGHENLVLIGHVLQYSLNQILLQLHIIKDNGKAVGDKLVHQLLVFVYDLYRYRKTALPDAPEGSTESGSASEVGDSCLQNRHVLVDQVFKNLLEVVRNQVKDNALDLLDGNRSRDRVKNEDQDGPKTAEPRDEIPRRYGLLLFIPEVAPLIASNFALVKSILTRVVDFVELSCPFAETRQGRGSSEDELIYLESYYNLISAMKDSSFFMNYNKDEGVLNLINETIEFVLKRLGLFYDKVGCAPERNSAGVDRLWREHLEYYWGVLVLLGNISLEFMDANIERLFRLLYLDFELFSTETLESDTLALLYGISEASYGCGSVDSFNDPGSGMRRGGAEGLLVRRLPYGRHLPSCYFVYDLIRQYNQIGQLNTFFTYVHSYCRHPGVTGPINAPGGPDDAGVDGGSSPGKRGLEGTRVISQHKRRHLGFSLNDSGGSSDTTGHTTVSPLDLNFMNNYCVFASILGLKMGATEVAKNLKTMGMYPVELYTLVVGYLRRLEFGPRNLHKVAEQFVGFSEGLEVQAGSLGLSLMLQLVLAVRKLVSFFNPVCQYESDEDPLEGEDAEGAVKDEDAERIVLNKLLLIVYKIYERVRDNFPHFLQDGRDDGVLFSILCHFQLLNNERFRVNFLHEHSTHVGTQEEDQDPLERQSVVLKMDFLPLLHDLLGRGNVAGAVVRNARLLRGSEKVQEYLLQNPDMVFKFLENPTHVSREVLKASLVWFLDGLSDGKVQLSGCGGNGVSGLRLEFQRAKMFLEKAMELENEVIVGRIMASIGQFYHLLPSAGSKKQSVVEGPDLALNLEKLVGLLELLLTLLDYEFLMSLTASYRTTVTCQEPGVGARGCGPKFNVFDVISRIKELLVGSGWDVGEWKRVLDLFVGYYYTFTRYLYKYYPPTAGSEACAPGVDNGLVARRLLVYNLLLNYLQPRGKARVVRGRGGAQDDWNSYFLCKYVEKLKLSGDSACLEDLMVDNGLIPGLIAAQVLGPLAKKDKQVGDFVGIWGARKFLDLLHHNLKLVDSVHVANLVLYCLNATLFTPSGDLLEEGDSCVSRLRMVLVAVIGALNEEDEYLFELYSRRENEELNLFFKKLFTLRVELYTRLAHECVRVVSKEGSAHRENYLMLVVLVRNMNKDESGGWESVLALVLEFVDQRQDLMASLLSSHVSPQHGSDLIPYSEAVCADLSREVLLNYLILSRLFVLADLKERVLGLMRIVYVLLGQKCCTDRDPLVAMALKLASMMVNSNINKSAYVVILYYQQFNHLVLRGTATCSELIRFTNVIMNGNSYKYVKNLVPVVLNVVINTFYRLSNPSGTDGSDGGQGPGYGGVEVSQKDREALRDGIMKCILMCDEKIKNNTYKLIKSSQVRLFYKDQFQRPR